MFQFPLYVWTGTVPPTEGPDTLFPSWTSKASRRNGYNGIVVSAIKILCGPPGYRQVLSLKSKYCNIQGAHPRVQRKGSSEKKLPYVLTRKQQKMEEFEQKNSPQLHWVKANQINLAKTWVVVWRNCTSQAERSQTENRYLQMITPILFWIQVMLRRQQRPSKRKLQQISSLHRDFNSIVCLWNKFLGNIATNTRKKLLLISISALLTTWPNGSGSMKTCCTTAERPSPATVLTKCWKHHTQHNKFTCKIFPASSAAKTNIKNSLNILAPAFSLSAHSGFAAVVIKWSHWFPGFYTLRNFLPTAWAWFVTHCSNSLQDLTCHVLRTCLFCSFEQSFPFPAAGQFATVPPPGVSIKVGRQAPGEDSVFSFYRGTYFRVSNNCIRITVFLIAYRLLKGFLD